MTNASQDRVTLVVARALQKRYGTGTAAVTALNGVDVEITAGELLAITGRSGSGKTTLLHCLSGITTPDAGTVTFDGIDLTTAGERMRTELRARRMAFVFQQLNLLPALTVAENVELPLVLRGEDAASIRAASTSVLEQVGLEGRKGTLPGDLSGGEQQRVAVARALIGRPDIIWADEPTGALDTATSSDVMKLLRGAVDTGRSVVVVSHAPDVADVADRVLKMRDGVIG
ncbi:MAG TPA: ABC transporter ATP-binding protein [Actinomycetota bacterium]|nr:ABC transporter ATP-binding protein [Actinomycetota bacterium]